MMGSSTSRSLSSAFLALLLLLSTTLVEGSGPWGFSSHPQADGVPIECGGGNLTTPANGRTELLQDCDNALNAMMQNFRHPMRPATWYDWRDAPQGVPNTAETHQIPWTWRSGRCAFTLGFSPDAKEKAIKAWPLHIQTVGQQITAMCMTVKSKSKGVSRVVRRDLTGGPADRDLGLAMWLRIRK